MNIQSKQGGGAGLNDLPEDLIILVLSLTSPRDACRLSVLNSQFRSAAESDQVWEGFIPADYLSKSPAGTTLFRCNSMPKRQLYFRICHNPLFFVGGRNLKCFAVDKATGKMNLCLGAAALSISERRRCWKFTSLPESRFGWAAAQIDFVDSLRIQGAINPGILSPGTYGAYLVFRMGKGSYGDGLLKAEASVEYGGGKPRFVSLHRNGVVKRCGGWLELKLGLVFIDGKEDGDVKITLMHHSAYWSKSSYLVVEGFEIRVHENPDVL